MFTDTLTITINAVAKALTRINQDAYSSEYYLRGTGESFTLRIRNTRYTDKSRGGKLVERHNFELVHRVEPVAPATVATIRKCYSVFEIDQDSVILDGVKFTAGTLAFLTEPNITKMANFES